MLDLAPLHGPSHTRHIALVFLTATLCLSSCSRPVAAPEVVGTWFVHMPTAPYPYHLFIFHADGSVIQSNPDAGDPRRSDSNLMGTWKSAGDYVTAKLVEPPPTGPLINLLTAPNSRSRCRSNPTNFKAPGLPQSSTQQASPSGRPPGQYCTGKHLPWRQFVTCGIGESISNNEYDSLASSSRLSFDSGATVVVETPVKLRVGFAPQFGVGR